MLKLYIKYLRTKICPNDLVDIVFPSSAEGGRQMSLASVWKILTKYKTKSGIRLTSRIARKSKITNSRKLNLTLGEKEAVAYAMGHDVATSDRYI